MLWFMQEFRMTREAFFKVLGFIAHHLEKQVTPMCKRPVGPAESLAIFLAYCARGRTFYSTGISYGVSPPTVCRVVQAASLAIWEEMGEEYVQMPTDVDGMRKLVSV
jgi:hypothetical protein